MPITTYLFQILKTTDIELQICHSDWLYHDTMVIIGKYDEVNWKCEDRARIMQSKLHIVPLCFYVAQPNYL